MKRSAPVLLAALTGILFALALPPRDQGWLGWIALTPLLIAAAQPGRRRLHAIGLGILASLVAGGVNVGVAPDPGGMRYAYLPYLWIGLVLGSVAVAATEAGRRWWPAGAGRNSAAAALRGVAFVAASGVAVEWLTTFSPLPVGVALTQYRSVPVLQTASVAGVWGVSCLLYLANATIADALLRRRVLPGVALPVLAVTVGVALAGWVASRLPVAAHPTLRVAAIQDFTGDGVKGLHPARMAEENSPDSAALTRQAAARGAKLVVWTEGGLGSSFHADNPYDETLQLAREAGAHLVVGYTQYAEPDAADARDRNRAALVSPGGDVLGTHTKIKLFLGERAAVQPGSRTDVFDTEVGRVGMLICFDTCFPAVVRQSARGGAQILAVPNYDPPTPGATLHHLHAAVVPFRAVENGVAIVRADPNGRSQILDPQGRTVAEAPLYRAEALVADVPLGSGTGTLYTRFGDWFAYACVGLSFSLLAAQAAGPSVSRGGTRRNPTSRGRAC